MSRMLAALREIENRRNANGLDRSSANAAAKTDSEEPSRSISPLASAAVSGPAPGRLCVLGAGDEDEQRKCESAAGGFRLRPFGVETAMANALADSPMYVTSDIRLREPTAVQLESIDSHSLEMRPSISK